MKQFNTYIAARPYKGVITRLPTWPGTPFFDSKGANVNAPYYACNSILVNWSDYGGFLLNAAVGVKFNLRGTNTPPIKRIEAIYIDNSFNDLPVYVVFPDTGYTVLAQANSVCCYPVFSMELQASIYCENFDGVNNPVTRIILLEKYISTWNNNPVAAITPATMTLTATHGNNGGVAANTIAVTLPASVVGNSLVLAVCCQVGLVTTPAGWTLQHSYITGFASFSSNYIFTKTATGAEGTALTVALDSARLASYGAFVVANQISGPGLAFIDNSGGVNMAVPSLTPAFGSASMWLALGIAGNGGNGFDAQIPTNYTQLFNEAGGAGSKAHIIACNRNAQLNVDNPAPGFTDSGNTTGFAALLAWN